MLDFPKPSTLFLDLTLGEFMLAAAAVLTAAAASLWSHRHRLYKSLDTRHKTIVGVRSGTPGIEIAERNLPPFDDRLAVLAGPLRNDEFEQIAAEIRALASTERSYLPSHKKGGTVAYETLVQAAPSVVAFYHSPILLNMISQIVGEVVQPTPLHDQSSCSVLFYERPGDHIGWHYDHNFYRGRHFTVLIPIVNRNADGSGLSAARLVAKVQGCDKVVSTPPNTLVVFEGAKVLHKATPIAEGERRIVLSMTFSTDPRNSMLQGIARRIKDTAFFGIRALWT